MADITVLTANTREKVGKGSAREARRQGNIPAVIYGDKKSPIPIVFKKKILEVVFLHFRLWVADLPGFDVKFVSSMSKSPRGQVLS